MGKRSLTGMRILVTRPAHQTDNLCRMIEDAGGVAVRFPTIEITASRQVDNAASNINSLNNYNWIIFVSKNAVIFSQKAYNGTLQFPSHLKVAALGKATSNALTEIGIVADVVAKPPYNSEALLACDQMQKVAGLKCLIVRGENGRELLAQSLRERGAQVGYAQVYCRKRPKVDVSRLLKSWRDEGLNMVTITSNEGLDNLIAMLGKRGLGLLRETPMLVISSRLKYKASEAGITHVVLASEASDAALYNSLCDFYQTTHDKKL